MIAPGVVGTGAIITPDGLICLPPDEAGALLLWMEYAESNGSL